LLVTLFAGAFCLRMGTGNSSVSGSLTLTSFGQGGHATAPNYDSVRGQIPASTKLVPRSPYRPKSMYHDLQKARHTLFAP